MQRPTKEQISNCPLYEGLALSDIYIIENEQDAQQALAVLQNEVCLGFDTETKPTFRKGQISPGPALIQLATVTNAYLFPTRFPAAVDAAGILLGDANIKKVGFGLRGDKDALRNKLAINLVNIDDLSVQLKHLIGEKNTLGARAAVALMLNQRLSKGAQKSNWGLYPLKTHQIKYAANDAHAAICVANALTQLGTSIS